MTLKSKKKTRNTTFFRYNGDFKNNDNGQVILFSRNTIDPELCVVTAAERIIRREQHLLVSPTHPVTVYRHHDSVFNITDSDAKKSIQTCAKTVYNLTSQLDISKFSNHSVRVGACVALHCAGVDTLTIKTRLRWQSDFFVIYLRNTPLLAATHTKLYNQNSADDIVT